MNGKEKINANIVDFIYNLYSKGDCAVKFLNDIVTNHDELSHVRVAAAEALLRHSLEAAQFIAKHNN